MLSPEKAIQHWNISGAISPSSDQGLINQTWLVSGSSNYILQWVNPIFSAKIHEDISAVVKHINANGGRLPRLIPLANGQKCLAEEDGTWRVLEFIPGTTVHTISNLNLAYSAGHLVGTFHTSLLDFDHDWIAPRRDIHNTPERMSDLLRALEQAGGHPLEREATELGEKILHAWNQWDGELQQPKRVCHGDLKISNIRFDEQDKGVCLIDLDTLGPQSLSVEMGDAWRSWCNPAGESDPFSVRFDIDIFRASAQGWLAAVPALERIEKDLLVTGIERICLELSARFCADAVNNSYFKEDRQRYPQKGQHNLTRALSQYRLSRSAIEHRGACEKIIKG